MEVGLDMNCCYLAALRHVGFLDILEISKSQVNSLMFDLGSALSFSSVSDSVGDSS